MDSKRQRVSIVTGGASGIGAAVSRTLASRGDQVSVFDLSEEPSASSLEVDNDAERASGGPIEHYAVDVSSELAVEQGFAEVMKKHGRVDVLVNCAGIDSSTSLIDCSLREWERIQRTNSTGVFLCSRAAARVMTRQRSGSIVSISSVNALLGWKNRSAYSASKGAIDGFTRAIAAELGEFGIRVNAIAPGAIATPIWGDTLTEEARAISGGRAALGYVGEPEDVAGLVAFLASEEARYITGAVIPVCGGRATCDYLATHP